MESQRGVQKMYLCVRNTSREHVLLVELSIVDEAHTFNRNHHIICLQLHRERSGRVDCDLIEARVIIKAKLRNIQNDI